MVYMLVPKSCLPPQTRVRSPVEAVFTFSCFTANLQIFTLFYFGVVYFTIKRKKKKQGSNCGQIFPKIVHQKIITVFEMQYSFCQTLNAIQTNIKFSKELTLGWNENNEIISKFVVNFCKILTICLLYTSPSPRD